MSFRQRQPQIRSSATTREPPHWSDRGPTPPVHFRFVAHRWDDVERTVEYAQTSCGIPQSTVTTPSTLIHDYHLHPTITYYSGHILHACTYRVRRARTAEYRTTIGFVRHTDAVVKKPPRSLIETVLAVHPPTGLFEKLSGDSRSALGLILAKASYELSDRLASAELAAWIEACSDKRLKPLRSLVDEMTKLVASNVGSKLAASL